MLQPWAQLELCEGDSQFTTSDVVKSAVGHSTTQGDTLVLSKVAVEIALSKSFQLNLVNPWQPNAAP